MCSKKFCKDWKKDEPQTIGSISQLHKTLWCRILKYRLACQHHKVTPSMIAMHSKEGVWVQGFPPGEEGMTSFRVCVLAFPVLLQATSRDTAVPGGTHGEDAWAALSCAGDGVEAATNPCPWARYTQTCPRWLGFLPFPGGEDSPFVFILLSFFFLFRYHKNTKLVLF